MYMIWESISVIGLIRFDLRIFPGRGEGLVAPLRYKVA